MNLLSKNNIQLLIFAEHVQFEFYSSTTKNEKWK